MTSAYARLPPSKKENRRKTKKFVLRKIKLEDPLEGDDQVEPCRIAYDHLRVWGKGFGIVWEDRRMVLVLVRLNSYPEIWVDPSTILARVSSESLGLFE
ncbi:hypothetical protein M0804_004453 [Polistes exclamans]|nr:hypothetical protein M0804_004453 [Polistes exclamans]